MTTHQLINDRIGWSGRMISGSKSGYRISYPNNFAIFNANICTNTGKIWWGDIDLTKSKDTLLEIAAESADDLYVLFEMDGRFENEESPILSKAAAVFKADGTYEIREDLRDSYQL